MTNNYRDEHHFIVSVFISFVFEGIFPLNSTKIPKIYNCTVWFHSNFDQIERFLNDSKMFKWFPEIIQWFSSNTTKFEIVQKFAFQIHKNSHPFDDFSSKIRKFQIIWTKFKIIQVRFETFPNDSNSFRQFHMFWSVFRRIPTSSTCIQKNSTTSGWLPVNVISVQSSFGQCRISLFVYWSVLPLRAPKCYMSNSGPFGLPAYYKSLVLIFPIYCRF